MCVLFCRLMIKGTPHTSTTVVCIMNCLMDIVSMILYFCYSDRRYYYFARGA